jgi:hypothetical protein
MSSKATQTILLVPRYASGMMNDSALEAKWMIIEEKAYRLWGYIDSMKDGTPYALNCKRAGALEKTFMPT